jgi:hypothetical protein
MTRPKQAAGIVLDFYEAGDALPRGYTYARTLAAMYARIEREETRIAWPGPCAVERIEAWRMGAHGRIVIGMWIRDRAGAFVRPERAA